MRALRPLPLFAATALLVAAVGCKEARRTPTTGEQGSSHQGPTPLRLTVVVIIDQLPSWTFDRDIAHLGGGLGRLWKEGVRFPRVSLPYAISFTAPGHATLATGAPPSVTGILANDWYDRATGEEVSAIHDPEARVFQFDKDAFELSNEPGVSSRYLRVEGLADKLRMSTGGQGKSIAVSLKDRAAILSAGRNPDLAIWYEPAQRAMTTSTFYVGAPPPWLASFNRNHPVAPLLTRTWLPLDAAALSRITARPDESPGEGTLTGKSSSFPYLLADAKDPARAFRATPFADELVLDTAMAAVDGAGLGADEIPDLLVVSLSAHDYAGHQFGQESWERLDVLMRVDQALAGFRDHLDKVVGPERYALVLTSDHGATPLVEESQGHDPDAHRVQVDALEEVARKAARSVFGDGEWIAMISASCVYLSPAALARDADERGRATAAIATALAEIPGIALATPTASITPPCESHRGARLRACNSIDPERSGEVFFTANEGSLVSRSYLTGTGHGSDSANDRTVPLVLWYPTISARTVEQEVSFTAIAATVAKLLQIPPPAAAAPGLAL